MKNKASKDVYKKRYEQTYAELLLAKDVIKKLKERIKSIEKNWLLEMHTHMQTKLEEYKPKLNPTTVSLNASKNRKSFVFEINPKNVICILTKQKKKYIYLKQAIESKKGEYIKTNEVIVNRNGFTLDDICKEIDKLNFWLIQVSNFAIINVDYYHLNNLNKLQLKDLLELNKFPDLKDLLNKQRAFEISLGPEFTENYKIVKEHFDDVISLQRLVFRGIDQ
jgi:hypothetical protein